MAKKNIQIIYTVTDAALLKAEKALRSNEAAANAADKSVNKFGKDAEQAGKNASKSFMDLGKVWKSLIAIGIASFLTNLAKKTFDLGVRQEQLNIAFTTFLGSAERAKKLLADLTKFAIVTPFTPEQVNQAARALLAFGFRAEEVIPTLKMLGDVSAGTGKDLAEMAVIFGQIRVAGRLMGQDLLQLINAGFNPLQIISQQTGKSVRFLRDEMEKGNISFEMVAESFKSVTSEGGLFFNLMEKQSQTVGGLLSTVSGNIDEILKNIFTANSGPIKEFTQGLLDASEAFLSLSKSAETKELERARFETELLVSGFKAFAEAYDDLNKAQTVNNTLLDQELVRLTATKKEMEDGVIPVNQVWYDQIVNRIDQINRERIAVREYINEVDTANLTEKLKKEAIAAEANAKALEKLRKQYHQNALTVMKQAPEENPDGTFGIDNLFPSSVLTPDQSKALEELHKGTLDKMNDANDTALQEAAHKEQANGERITQIRHSVFNYSIGLLDQLLNATVKNSEDEVQIVQDKYDKLLDADQDFADQQQDVAGNNERAKMEIQVNADRRRKELEKEREKELDTARTRQAKKEKEIAIKRMIIENVLNSIKALGTPPVPNFGAAGLALAFGAIGTGVAAAVGFKDGVIGLQGPGTGRSDSIPANLSRGESVITADATTHSRSLLEAIQERKIDDRILSKLVVGKEGITQHFDDAGIIKAVNRLGNTDSYEQGHSVYRRVKKSDTLTEHIRSKYRN